MMKAGKIWGMTELIEANGALEFHRIEMNKGGVCSKHLHEFKWNGFYVESGRMLIRVWQNDYDLVDETIQYIPYFEEAAQYISETEAAQAALQFAFDSLNLDEVVSFTTTANDRSRAVMKKLGMSNSKQNFMHPDIDISHPQCEHVLYKISRSEWRKTPL